MAPSPRLRAGMQAQSRADATPVLWRRPCRLPWGGGGQGSARELVKQHCAESPPCAHLSAGLCGPRVEGGSPPRGKARLFPSLGAAWSLAAVPRPPSGSARELLPAGVLARLKTCRPPGTEAFPKVPAGQASMGLPAESLTRRLERERHLCCQREGELHGEEPGGNVPERYCSSSLRQEWTGGTWGEQKGCSGDWGPELPGGCLAGVGSGGNIGLVWLEVRSEAARRARVDQGLWYALWEVTMTLNRLR